MQPIVDALPTRAETKLSQKPHITLVVTGLLSMLPLHAARIVRNGRRVAVLDDYIIGYSPSARALERRRDRPSSGETTAPTFLGVADPSPPPAPLTSLPFAATEAKCIGTLFGGGAMTLCESEATLSAVERHLEGVTHLHFSCHGRFDAKAPRDSAILLADATALSVGDLLAHRRLAGKEVVTLASCETALTDFSRLPDEAIGLPMAFIHGGVARVVGSLWPVDDLATMFLMISFYERHVGGVDPSVALNDAQTWLRDARLSALTEFCEARARDSADDKMRAAFASARDELRADTNTDDCPFADPSSWAPFVFVGR